MRIENEEKICHIFGAGDFHNNGIKVNDSDLVIAADGGYDHLKNISIKPYVILGDFDSVSPGFKEDDGIDVIGFPSEKDETDMMIAVRYGLDKGYDTFHIYGATGGRLSHTVANIQLLAFLCNNGAKGYIFDEKTVITAVKDGRIDFDSSFKGFISVFSHSDVSKEVYIKGLKYDVNGDDLTNDVALGISNEFVGSAGSVSVEKGILVVVIESRSIST